jgi:hypothetical protein
MPLACLPYKGEKAVRVTMYEHGLLEKKERLVQRSSCNYPYVCTRWNSQTIHKSPIGEWLRQDATL